MIVAAGNRLYVLTRVYVILEVEVCQINTYIVFVILMHFELIYTLFQE